MSVTRLPWFHVFDPLGRPTPIFLHASSVRPSPLFNTKQNKTNIHCRVCFGLSQGDHWGLPNFDIYFIFHVFSVLEEDGFGDEKFFHCFVAEDKSKPDGLIGYVLYFYIYSTWEGRSIYMEDLYVTPEARGQGVGMALWRSVVKVSIVCIANIWIN